ncbi:hypothetical protein [Modestobacter marinus]|uniref:hypothetical protein n=1 Tax=Modestobacter marinus TaxID=477641 RepID=UPI0021BBCB14|nr:hypothetical protein [Modestobacter marinus]
MDGLAGGRGVQLQIFTEPQTGATYDDLLAVARRTEETGFEALRSDHYLAMSGGRVEFGLGAGWFEAGTSGIPVLVGGHSARRTPRLAARYAAEFNVPVGSMEGARQRIAEVRASCHEAGRDRRR